MLRDFLKWSRIPKGLKKEIRYRHIITFEAIMIVKNYRISYNMLLSPECLFPEQHTTAPPHFILGIEGRI